MTEFFPYSLSGPGATPDRMLSFVNLFIEAGAIFSTRPKFSHMGVKLLFFLLQPMSSETEKAILQKLDERGIKKARLESCGKYSKQ